MMSDKHVPGITVIHLKQLLTELKEQRPDILIRYRLLGEMWIPNFRRIIIVTEKGAVFNDEDMNKLVRLPDLSMIMQFEIDHAFMEFQPHFHYTLGSIASFSS